MSSVGPIIIMSTIHITNKGRLMDTLGKFYIFREAKPNNQTNDKLAVRPNIIFEATVQKDPHRRIHICHTGRTLLISVEPEH